MTSLSQVELCIQYLREVGKSWQSATNIAEILSRLLQQQLKPVLDKAGFPGLDQAQRPTSLPLKSSQAASTSSDVTTSPHSNASSPVPSSSVHTSPHSTLSAALEPNLTSRSEYSQSNDYSPPGWLHPADPQFLDQDLSSAVAASFTSMQTADIGFMPPFYNLNYDSGYLQQQLGDVDPMQVSQDDLVLFERLYQQTSQGSAST